MDLSCQRGFQFISLLVVGWVEVMLLCFTLSAFIRLRFCAPGPRISQTISKLITLSFIFSYPQSHSELPREGKKAKAMCYNKQQGELASHRVKDRKVLQEIAVVLPLRRSPASAQVGWGCTALQQWQN